MDKLPLKELERLVKEKPGYELLKELKEDNRKGAAKLAKRLEAKLEQVEAKRKKTKEMFVFEEVIVSGKEIIAGADEAGRGPLAGPIVAAAVILDKKREWFWLDDSKRLSKNEREKLYQEIKEKSLDYGLGIINVKKIDKSNIANANMFALAKALNNLKYIPDVYLFDGNRIPRGYEDKGEAVVKGDKKSASIAAAGILAKVVRDRIMEDLHNRFPSYGFSENKGYPTKKHFIALKKFGPTPVHRKSFLKGGDYEEEKL